MSWGCKLESRLRLGRALLEDATQAIGGHRVATRGDEQGAAAAVPQKRRDAPRGCSAARPRVRAGKAGRCALGSFAEEPHARIGEVDVAELEARYFGDVGTACAYRSSRKA